MSSLRSAEAVDLKLLLSLFGLGVDADNWKYDVNVFKLEYTTPVDGIDVLASALVIIPDTEEEVSMISYQHGTITAHDSAPTEISGGSAESTLYNGLASLGLVAIFPDLVGFGSSVEMIHPYYVQDINANTVRNAIIATYEYLIQEEIAFDGDLYLAGYSQGGYVTMATQELLERDPIRGLDLEATFPAAGAYDVKGLQEYFLTLTTYEQPHYFAYVGLSYIEYFDLDVTLADIFNAPYAERIPDLFDGTLTGSAINGQLSFDIDGLLTPDFVFDLETDPRFQGINDQFSKNGLLDWAPRVRTHLYHGDEDTFIPLQNSIDTYTQLIENGTSEETLTLTIIQGADHGGGVIPYAGDVANRLVDFLAE